MKSGILSLLLLLGGPWVAAAPIDNVVLIIADDLRASVLGCFGDRLCQTPNLDRLAARGVVFERAYCQGTVCGPSRASLMRGRYFGHSGPTLGEHLISQGRTTARVGKIFHMRVPGDIIAGSDGEDVPGCWSERHNAAGQEAHTPGDYACLNLDIFTTQLEGRQSTGDPHRPFVTVSYHGDGSDQPDAKAAAKSIEVLRRFKADGRPFLLATGFVRPHYPMVAPRLFDRYPLANIRLPPGLADDLADIPPLGIAGSHSKENGLVNYPENQRRMWAGYYAAVTFMDQQVGRILDEIDRLELAKSTAIVFTSDHGYHLGEHTFWQKANLHEQVTRVPLIIAAPGVAPGRSRSIAQLVDLVPTLCELSGATIPSGVEGTSLVPVLREVTAQVNEAAFSYVQGGHYAMRGPRWAYMRYSDGSEELYDMEHDSDQFHNLAALAEHRATLEVMRQQLDQRLLASVGKPSTKKPREKKNSKP
jgi:iduronate 2-sulfatase